MNIAVINIIEIEAGNYFLPLTFQNGSASYQERTDITDAGTLYKCELKFKVAGLERLAGNHISRLQRCDSIRFSDVNGLRVTLGSKDIPVNVEVEKNINGKLGGYRGYDVIVRWNSPFTPNSQSFT